MFDRAGIDVSGIQAIVPAVDRVLAAARSAGTLVCYLRMGFSDDLGDAGYPTSPTWLKHVPLRVGDRVTAPDGTLQPDPRARHVEHRDRRRVGTSRRRPGGRQAPLQRFPRHRVGGGAPIAWRRHADRRRRHDERVRRIDRARCDGPRFPLHRGGRRRGGADRCRTRPVQPRGVVAGDGAAVRPGSPTARKSSMRSQGTAESLCPLRCRTCSHVGVFDAVGGRVGHRQASSVQDRRMCSPSTSGLRLPGCPTTSSRRLASSAR